MNKKYGIIIMIGGGIMGSNILKLKDKNGNDIEIEALDMIENEENNKKYIVYRIKNSEDVFVSILNETDDSYSLETIEDDNEFKAIEKFLARKAKEIIGDKSL